MLSISLFDRLNVAEISPRFKFVWFHCPREGKPYRKSFCDKSFMRVKIYSVEKGMVWQCCWYSLVKRKFSFKAKSNFSLLQFLNFSLSFFSDEFPKMRKYTANLGCHEYRPTYIFWSSSNLLAKQRHLYVILFKFYRKGEWCFREAETWLKMYKYNLKSYLSMSSTFLPARKEIPNFFEQRESDETNFISLSHRGFDLCLWHEYKRSWFRSFFLRKVSNFVFSR